MEYSENQRKNLIKLALTKINYTDELKEYIEYVKENSKNKEESIKDCENSITDFEDMVAKEYNEVLDNKDIDNILLFINSNVAKKIFNKELQKKIRFKVLEWQSNKMPKIKG